MTRAILIAACWLAAWFAASAQAQEFPNRPITFIVPWSAGGATDIVCRTIAAEAAKHLGQPIIVDNKTGGGGTVGPATMAATAKPDGYTIAQIAVSVFRYPIMQAEITYDPLKDFTYIANMSGYVFAIYAGAHTNFKKWQDVIDFARANPGKVTYATPGAGTSPNIGTELIAAHSGVKFSHAPFKSTAEVTTAVLGGHTMLGSTAGLDAKQLEDTGKLKFLNVWTEKRVDKVADVPTLKELGYPFVFDSPWGIAGPKGMDPAVVKKLEDAFRKAMDDKTVQDTMEKYEMFPKFMDSATYTKWVAGYMVSEREDLTRIGYIKAK
jgi:tripartite-type tricarboxylate transporter receptor subunit TctC